MSEMTFVIGFQFLHFNSEDINSSGKSHFDVRWLCGEKCGSFCRRSRFSCSTSDPRRNSINRSAGKRSRTSYARARLGWNAFPIRSSCRYVRDTIKGQGKMRTALNFKLKRFHRKARRLRKFISHSSHF